MRPEVPTAPRVVSVCTLNALLPVASAFPPAIVLDGGAVSVTVIRVISDPPVKAGPVPV